MKKLISWIKSILIRWLKPEIPVVLEFKDIRAPSKIIYIENKVQVLRGLGTVALTPDETKDYLNELEFSVHEDKHIQ